ncbi:hypothetical protein [Limnobacter sp. P1]|uniref:DUF7694 domain-containing protein n=1 Tax=Limnobacter olei TaxID=3031298 RepID=UPI0023AF568E|nr:hypothetical protein [Limnobacter sp. P1]
MKTDLSKVNKYRIRRGQLASTDDFGPNGAFYIPHFNEASTLSFQVIASNSDGWEHVSVSLPKRTPTWDEMCFIKDLFWEDEEVVMQLHPRKSDYINMHKHCLHLWKPTSGDIVTPPKSFVGF